MSTPKSPLPKMVGWYDPRQLIRTGIDVAISTIFGRNSDFRLLEALASREIEDYYDHSVECDVIGLDDTPQVVETDRQLSEVWLDYIADVGDGWDSTYCAAYNIAQDLELTSPDAKTYKTQRGSVLIFGGDEVYPVASVNAGAILDRVAPRKRGDAAEEN
jgi:hypothetical protein